MIDHIYLPVSDLERSSEFYKKMLEPLGIDMPYKFDQLHGFAINSNPGFWLKNGEVAKDLYVAFTAKSADAVRASYKAAIDAGATSNKEPSLRPEWRADYFAANIGDPDGTQWLKKPTRRAAMSLGAQKTASIPPSTLWGVSRRRRSNARPRATPRPRTARLAPPRRHGPRNPAPEHTDGPRSPPHPPH